MIRLCTPADFASIHTIINDAAQAYRGVIPADRWHEPYMPESELRQQIDDGVVFSGFDVEGELLGVMGLQHVQDVTLIRHAYVRTPQRGRGIGSQLLTHLCEQTTRPILIGTWAAATWAISFYQKHAFRLVTPQQKDMLLQRYWSIPSRQVDTSVVLADERWFATQSGDARGLRA
jgi:GNAT superfamily N-acetyltransferase